jgi:hypothetical protein
MENNIKIVFKQIWFDFHIRTVRRDIKVYYSPTDAQVIVWKAVLKFTLK